MENVGHGGQGLDQPPWTMVDTIGKNVLLKGIVSGMKVVWFNMEYVGGLGQECNWSLCLPILILNKAERLKKQRGF